MKSIFFDMKKNWVQIEEEPQQSYQKIWYTEIIFLCNFRALDNVYENNNNTINNMLFEIICNIYGIR